MSILSTIYSDIFVGSLREIYSAVNWIRELNLSLVIYLNDVQSFLILLNDFLKKRFYTTFLPTFKTALTNFSF